MSFIEVIQRDNKFYSIPQTPEESREIYLERVNQIINMLSDPINNKKSFDDIINLSYVWRNTKLLGMNYPNAIAKQL